MRGNRRQPTFADIGPGGRDVRRRLRQQLLTVFDAGVGPQERARGRRGLLGGGPAFGRGGRGGGRVGGRVRGFGGIAVMLIGGGRGGGAVEQNPWLKGQGLALRAQVEAGKKTR
ncbi:hypothetical protein PS938_05652 [Pseudomonas fluorescens]|uniref:Uncharacterized protein n=1 Tax=Pseudomonas fluorescens TaxID=294 RepID=A0A5E7VQT7_PSEFL|nr:hypothetical protein PS938_05652 [Pseudomonas fluorescens]